MKPTIKSTFDFVKKAHGSQKYGTSPYWTHLLAVAEKGKELFGSKFTDTAYMVALLHDVLEDTHITATDLQKMGYSGQVIDAVQLVTKDTTLSYDANIQRIVSSRNIFAQMVKFADNMVNYTGDKSGWNLKRVEKSQAKYMESMKTLGSILGIDPHHYLS